MNLLTKNLNTESNIIYYLNLNHLKIYGLLSKANYAFLKKNPIYKFLSKHKHKSIDAASKSGKLEILIWWEMSGSTMDYTTNAVDYASLFGHYAVMEWWLKRLELKYTYIAINGACENNHLSILKLWFNSKLNLKYTHMAIDMASINGYVNILNCWISFIDNSIKGKNISIHNDLELEYSDFAIDRLYNRSYNFTEETPLSMLKWWKASGLEMKYTFDIIDSACRYGDIDVLEWFIVNNLRFNYEEAVYYSSVYNHIDVLNWWKNHGLPFNYDHEMIDAVSENGHIDVLNWWKDSGMELKYSENALRYALTNKKYDVVNWWLSSGLEVKYNNQLLNEASRDGNIHVLEWFLHSGLELKYSLKAMIYATMKGHTDVLEWWKNSGLKLKYPKNILDWIRMQYSLENNQYKYKSYSKKKNLERSINWWQSSGLKIST